MARYEFQVKGSVAEPYTVTFERSGANLTALCTCKAAQNGQHCKHRLEIMRGESKGIVSDNVADAASVPAMVDGSDVEPYLREVERLEAEAGEIKKRLAGAKKTLARRMMD
ncbi:hypothetical protein [Lentisalinibacter sediminis]|uniref:hypothetical protein n=1 Tax=Lentisalinibacter sediminis TaxID=2992237 RepID=UPI00386EB299